MDAQQPDGQTAFARVPGDGAALVCCRCRQRITDSGQRCMVQGASSHTCVNPAGIIYQLSCFRAAPGVGYSGSPTTAWSWFAGYSWSVAHCRGCGQHMGWLFLGQEGESFHALITQRLCESG